MAEPMNDEQRARMQNTGVWPVERWPQSDGDTPLVCHLPTESDLRELIASVPHHVQCSGWYLGKHAFGEVSIYADNFRGMGRQHIASIPKGARYFGRLGEYIAAAHPRTLLRLLDQLSDAAAELEVLRANCSGFVVLGSKSDLDCPAYISEEFPTFAQAEADQRTCGYLLTRIKAVVRKRHE